ncbi:hypothetical protein [Ovoidimarina sediminis]|uniref:hypothetical protein n=1 Tax=Ovoidimarina sediminis TaxID=3079856 RepID=UPI00291280D2|nr:hypothetical protein [Rhodophyticola sp. MJ-SS7]MDU8946701.1 hypothetical protein [Rhodophyticola sp. MJ-SS7]
MTPFVAVILANSIFGIAAAVCLPWAKVIARARRRIVLIAVLMPVFWFVSLFFLLQAVLVDHSAGVVVFVFLALQAAPVAWLLTTVTNLRRNWPDGFSQNAISSLIANSVVWVGVLAWSALVLAEDLYSPGFQEVRGRSVRNEQEFVASLVEVELHGAGEDYIYFWSDGQLMGKLDGQLFQGIWEWEENTLCLETDPAAFSTCSSWSIEAQGKVAVSKESGTNTLRSFKIVR